MFSSFRSVTLLLGQGKHMVSTAELYREKLRGSCWVVHFVFRPLSLQILIVLSESLLAVFNEICFSFPQLVFSFNDKLFGLLVKDMEAMDPSILKGESGTSKKQKVGPRSSCPFLGAAELPVLTRSHHQEQFGDLPLGKSPLCVTGDREQHFCLL